MMLLKTAKIISKKLILKQNVDFMVVDFHGEITSEKMAIGHFFDGLSTCVVGTHTHVPTGRYSYFRKRHRLSN
jgi:calcineurin-like phosphoesterase